MAMNVKTMVAVAALGAVGVGAWWFLGASAGAKTDVFGGPASGGRPAAGAVSALPANGSGTPTDQAAESQASTPAWLKPGAPATQPTLGATVPGQTLPQSPGVKMSTDPAEMAKEQERLQKVRIAAQRLREVSSQKSPDPKAVVEAMRELEVANGGPMMNGVDLAALRKSNELLLGLSNELQSMQALAERVERGDKTIPDADYKAHLEKMRKIHEQILNNAPAVPSVPVVPGSAKSGQ